LELWRPVVGFEGFYEVSDLGRIKSLPRERSNGKGRWISREKILSHGVNQNGYEHVTLQVKGKSKSLRVHSIVSAAFLGERNGLDIDHIDGNKRNNRADNLQLISRRANTNKGRAGLLKKNKGSRFTGVNFDKDRGKWRAVIYIDGKTKFLGRFDSEEKAAEAYKNAIPEN